MATMRGMICLCARRDEGGNVSLAVALAVVLRQRERRSSW